MDKLSRNTIQKTMRFFSNKGYKVLTEFALPNKKRVDIIAINIKKQIVIVEVKSNQKKFKIDKKWKKYLNYCNYFYFSFNKYEKNIKLSKNIGIIQTNKTNAEVKKNASYTKMSKEEKNNLILNFALSAASKFHRLVDPNFKKQKNNSIFIYKKTWNK